MNSLFCLLEKMISSKITVISFEVISTFKEETTLFEFTKFASKAA